MIFSDSIKKQENGNNIQYKVRITDSVKFMVSSLSRLSDNLTEGQRKGKYKDCKLSLEYKTVKDGLQIFNCKCCNKIYEKKFDEDLFKTFKNNIASVMEKLKIFVLC